MLHQTIVLVPRTSSTVKNLLMSDIMASLFLDLAMCCNSRRLYPRPLMFSFFPIAGAREEGRNWWNYLQQVGRIRRQTRRRRRMATSKSRGKRHMSRGVIGDLKSLWDWGGLYLQRQDWVRRDHCCICGSSAMHTPCRGGGGGGVMEHISSGGLGKGCHNNECWGYAKWKNGHGKEYCG